MTAEPMSSRVPDKTKLLIGRYEPGEWFWAIVEPDGNVLDDGMAASWSQALAIGLAACQQAVVEHERISV